MKKVSFFVLLFAACACGSAQTYLPDWESLNTRKIPGWFQQEKFGIFIHFGVYSVPSYYSKPGPNGYAEWYWNSYTSGKKGTKEFHDKNYGADFSYYRFAPQFKCELFDAAQWARLFKKAGAKYVVLTSKHHDGFCLWPSKEADIAYHQPWNSYTVGPKRDIAGELTSAVKEQGLRMGFYYSLYEWYNPIWLYNKEKYVNEHLLPQFKDLVSRYNPSIIFGDGEWDLTSEEFRSKELLAWAFNNNPELVVNDRWGKETRGKYPCTYFTTEYGAGLNSDVVWEENRGIGYSFGYNRMERALDYKSGSELIVVLCDIVSKGGNLLLDIGPAADGSIPVIMEDRLLQIGSWLDRYGDAIYGTKAWIHTRQWSDGKEPVFSGPRDQSGYDINQYLLNKNNGEAYLQAFFTEKGNDLNVIMTGYYDKIIIKEVNSASSASIARCNKTIGMKKVAGGLELDLSELRPGDADGLFVIKLTNIK